MLESPPGSGGVAVISIHAGAPEDLEGALRDLGLWGRGLPVGGLGLRDVLGIDVGVCARWTLTEAHLYPHAGVGVVAALREELTARGYNERPAQAPIVRADEDLEAAMAAALGVARSPLAIDLLLDQPRRWRAGTAHRAPTSLHRLIRPPLIVAWGAANIGKSTLANTLAGRSVALVHDEPGTTRDHVGVTIDLAGLVARYVDTPGVRPEGATDIERESAAIALSVSSRADLVLLCGDAVGPGCIDPPAHRPSVRVALRSDLGPPAWKADAAVSSRTGAGVAELVAMLREALVPREALEDPHPWAFWEAGSP